ncbi:MAG: hypothetical protein ACOY93_10900 [Bacillota bacterium]
MRKAVPVLLIVGFAAFIIYMISGMKSVQETPPGPISLPEQFGAFRQTYLATGEEGLLNFDRQHKKRIPIKEGVKGEYTDGTVKVDLWVANGAGPTHAHQMFMEMASTIGTDHLIFTQPKPVELGSITGYRTEGQEAVNFFFTKDGRVYWIGIRGGNPDEVVKTFLSGLVDP